MTTAAPPRPYKGLAPFEDSEQDAALFFGRDRERDVITANLLASRLTVLYGASGVGKSSLLRAGVAHELGKTEEVVVSSSWSEDPLTVLDHAAALAAERGELFLILDQLEEFFLYHGGNGENGAGTEFASRLAELIQHPDLHVSVLLGIREDSLARLDAFKGRLPNVLGNYLRLEHLERREARAAIVEPLKRYGKLGGAAVAIEAALVEAVLDEVSAVQIADGAAPPGRIETPYLQLVMDRIWEVEQAAGSSLLRLDTLRELGGAERIVREHLDRALAALTPAQQATAALMFDHLVTPSGAKIAHALPDLVSYAAVDAAAAHGVIARLEGERILRPVEGGKVEIFHDVLGGSVAAWRRDYEASRELGRARRRSRRLAALAAGSLAALAVVSVVALYALSQRREAQQQAAVAQAALVRAEKETQRAEASKAAEVKARKVAVRQKAIALDRKREAEASEKKATDALASAQTSEEKALDSAQAAQRSEGETQDALERAEASEQLARDEAAQSESLRKVADASAVSARANARSARARLLVAQSTAVIDQDPWQSIEKARTASQLEPSYVPAEDALRDALAAFRLRAVLLAGGGNQLASDRTSSASSKANGTPPRAAAFSPGRDLTKYVVTASPKGGVRLFNVNPGRKIRTFKPYADANSVTFSPDAHTLAAATRSGQALLWNVDSGLLQKTLPHPGNVTEVEFTSDGQLVVTGGADGKLRVWEPASGLQLGDAIDAGGPVSSLSLQPGGRQALVVTRDRSARVFDLASGRLEVDLTRGDRIFAADFSPDGDVVVAGGAENAYVWQVRGWQLRSTLQGHTSTITDVAFTADSERVLTVSADSTGRVWSTAGGRTPTPVLTFTGSHEKGLLSGAVSSRGDSWATASSDGTVALWIEGTLSLVPVILAPRAGPVHQVEFSPDGWTVLTASKDGNVRLWRARDPNLHLVSDQGERSARAAFSPSGDRLVTATADGTLRLFTADGTLIQKFAHGAAVNSITFGGSGLFATAGQDGIAKVWGPDGSLRSTCVHGSPIRVVTLAPGDRRVATGSDDGRVVVCGAAGNHLRELSQGAGVTSIEFASPGTLVTGGADGSVAVWDVRSGSRRSLAPHKAAVTDVAISRRGLVATASDDRTAHVYDLRSGIRLRLIQGHLKAVNVVAFSPNGKVLLTASTDGDVRIWKTKTWKGDVLRGHRGVETGAHHDSALSGARFSPDGRWIVTSGRSAAGIWLTRTGDLLFFIRGHLRPLLAASFARDDRRMLTASVDGTMRDYRCDLCGKLSALQELANARLKLAERGRKPSGR